MIDWNAARRELDQQRIMDRLRSGFEAEFPKNDGHPQVVEKRKASLFTQVPPHPSQGSKKL